MSRISKKETNSNIIFDYSLDQFTKGDIFDWLLMVSQNNNIHIEYINCTNLLDRSDEGNESFTLKTIVSKEKIINLCKSNGINIISIIATFEQKPVIIGVKLKTMSPFITVRKNKLVDYKKLEKKLFLV